MGTYYIPNDSWLEPVDPSHHQACDEGRLTICASTIDTYFTQTMS